jgi:hypothetical protein
MTPQGNFKAIRPRRWRQLGGCLALAGALSSCDLRPPPLLSPLAATGEYGYADVALGDDRYQVSYTGPGQRSLRSVEAREQIAAAERTQAYDFALWHAAQVAQARGFTGFRASNVRTNVDTMADENYESPYSYGGYPYRRFGDPFMPFGTPYGGPNPYLYTRTQIVIDVALLRSLESGDYDAAETIERLSKAYPNATSPAAAPAG